MSRNWWNRTSNWSLPSFFFLWVLVIFNILNRFKYMRKKIFRGHMVAGYACGLDFSPDMRFAFINREPGLPRMYKMDQIL